MDYKELKEFYFVKNIPGVHITSLGPINQALEVFSAPVQFGPSLYWKGGYVISPESGCAGLYVRKVNALADLREKYQEPLITLEEALRIAVQSSALSE